MLLVIANSEMHFRHIIHMYRIAKNDAKYVRDVYQLRGLPPSTIIIFGDEWWRNRPPSEVGTIEALVAHYDKVYKKGPRP